MTLQLLDIWQKNVNVFTKATACRWWVRQKVEIRKRLLLQEKKKTRPWFHWWGSKEEVWTAVIFRLSLFKKEKVYWVAIPNILHYYVILNFSTITNNLDIDDDSTEDIDTKEIVPMDIEESIIKNEVLCNEQECEEEDREEDYDSRIKNSEDELQLFKQIAQQQPLPRVPNEEDETDLFFTSMAKIVKKLPPYERIQLRMKIGTLVGNAELKYLK